MAPSPETAENILVRGVNWVGDAVMTMPALREIKRLNPGAKLSLLVRPSVSALFEHDPNIDEIILYDDAARGPAGKIALAGRLRKKHFSRAYLLQNAFDAALIAVLSGIPERIGYSRDARRLLLTSAVPFDAQAAGLHHIEYYLNLLQQTGHDAAFSHPWIYLRQEERKAARSRLSLLKRPVVGLNPGAAFGSSKRWLPERFAEVGVRFIKEKGAGIVIYGGPKEQEIAAEIEKGILEKCGADAASGLLNLAGSTTLRELAALISETDLLITNDSGPMHIGYAVGTPLVAIFGSTSAAHTGPRGRDVAVVSHELDCAPCFKRECNINNDACMDLVTADEVFEAGAVFLKHGRAVFFDRDGTLCRDAHYLSRMEDFALLPGMEELRKLSQLGYKLIGISNQSGIARGKVKEDFVKEVNDIFIRRFGFDAFYYCPHHPDDHCSCRKPEPGLLLRARADHSIDLKRSFMVGDKEIDMQLAEAVGAQAIHVGTGQEGHAPSAGHHAQDLAGVVRIISG